MSGWPLDFGMCKGVTVCGLATPDVSASHAHTCWSAHATFRASGVVGLKSRAVVSLRCGHSLASIFPMLDLLEPRLKSILQNT